MTQIGFSNEKYLEAQEAQVSQLINNKAYADDAWFIEVGGKLIQDRHSARVLPGFDEDVRFSLVKDLAKECSVVMAVSAKDVARKRIRGDFKTTYDNETFRTINELSERGLKVDHIAITRVESEMASNKIFKNFLKMLSDFGYSHTLHKEIESYTAEKLSESDLDADPEIPLKNKKVLVISPGGGSGKFGLCLILLYQAMQKGTRSHYLSIGAFPMYDLPPSHPLNLAYLAATADFGDNLFEDPNSASSIVTEREIQNYELLQKTASFFDKESQCLKEIPSASNMCVSELSKGITDMETVEKEAAAEIARRYMRYKYESERGEEQPAVAARVKELFDLL